MKDKFAVIREYCTVIAETENAILYRDGGWLYAEINGTPFSCSSTEEFFEMVNFFGDETFEE